MRRLQKAALLVAVLLALLPGRQGIPLSEHQLLVDAQWEGNPVDLLKKLLLAGHNGIGADGQGHRKDLPWPTVDQYLGAAGWRVGDDLSRLPIVFIPPFSGTRLLQRLEDRPIKTPLDVMCERDTAGEWQSMWLPSKETKSESFVLWQYTLPGASALGHFGIVPRAICCAVPRLAIVISFCLSNPPKRLPQPRGRWGGWHPIPRRFTANSQPQCSCPGCLQRHVPAL